MHYEFYPEGVCSRKIDFDIDGDVITNVRFTGGCNGNLKAIAILVDGMTVDEIERKLKGNTCGFKNTSCADQFAKGVLKAYNETVKACRSFML